MTRRLLVAVLAACLCASVLSPANGPAYAQASSAPPKLVVLLVADQVRTDFLEHYGLHWTGGLKRIMERGAWFRNAAYPYLNTVTCVGHATISTGKFPRNHGIVLNSWLDRQTGKVVDCAGDPSKATVTPDGQTPGGESVWRLRGGTFADQIKSAGGRVITMSLKARSAIMPAGRRADAAIWFGGTGTFVSSTAYVKELPAFVTNTLKATPISTDRTKTWTRLLPPDAYVGPDKGVGERTPATWTTEFPHSLDAPQFLSLWQASPMADAYLTKLAMAAVDEYKLGQRDRTDFLSVSYSTPDVVGHSFGPDSHEVQDILARLDQQIDILLDYLDDKVGSGKYVVAFTSDHGVASIPERAHEQGQDAGRIDMNLVRTTVERTLRPLFGRSTTPAVAGILYTDIYLMPDVPDRMAEQPEALGLVKKALQNVPGVWRVFGAAELERVNERDPVQKAAALSHHRGRSGDIIMVPKRGWIASSAGTTHGTLHDYDQRVPVIFFGAGVSAGLQDAAASPADIAPTLARIAGIKMNGTDGRALPVGPVSGPAQTGARR